MAAFFVRHIATVHLHSSKEHTFLKLFSVRFVPMPNKKLNLYVCNKSTNYYQIRNDTKQNRDVAHVPIFGKQWFGQ